MASAIAVQPVAVTGIGVVTSLGIGKADNWSKLTAGQSGIRAIRRFPTDGLKTTIAGTVDFVPVEPFCSTDLGERMADIVAEEAIARIRHRRQGRLPRPAVPRGGAGRDRMAATRSDRGGVGRQRCRDL